MKYGRDRMYNNPTMQNSNLLRRFILSCLLLSAFVIFGCSPKSLQVKQGSIKPGEKLAGEIERLEISEEMERTKVAIHGSSPITYTVYKLAEPPRIVVDILQADLGKLMGTIAVNNGTINTIKSTQVDSEAGTVGRIAIGLDKIVDYDVVKETNSLILYVKKSVEQEVPHDAKTHVKEIGTVENIDFKHIMGKSQIKVYTSRKARCNVSRISDDTVVLELIEMEIPERLQQSLYIEETESVVEMIKPYQTVISGIKAVRIDIKLRAMVPYYMFQEENTVQIDFDQPHEAVSRKVSATPSPAPVVPETKVEAAVMAKGVQAREEEVEKAGKVIPSDDVSVGDSDSTRRYTGRRISLDFKDADIKNLFRLIAEVSNLNIIAGDDVKGKVTIRMVNVPWDQALDVILATNNLGKVRVGNVVRIAPSEKLRAEEKTLIASKKEKEEVEPLVTEIIPINYATAKDVLAQIEGKLSKRGKSSADERTNSIVITDVAGVREDVKKIIGELDSATPQVLIEARIVQSNPTFTRELGIQWGGTLTKPRGLDTYTIAGEAGSNYAINLPASLIHGGLGFAFAKSSATLDIKLTAMEKDEKVKIISRPKIVTLDNTQATVEQGVDLPYPTLSSEGTISTEFKKATLKLEVTPYITPDGSIRMKVLVKKDQKSAQTGYGGEPGIDTRSAQTEVLVKNGETTVIGGIYERTQTYVISGVPFLSKIPILGWLFKNKYKKDEITELLIFLTPTIIKQTPVT